MANKSGRRRFGSVRQLPSGRYQVRYPGRDGQTRTAQETYERKGDAEKALSVIETQMIRGDWIDPVRGRIKLRDYAATWIEQRPGLRPKTVDLYRWLLRAHVGPALGGVQLGKLGTDLIRQWRADLLKAGVSASVTAKAYRFLHAVLATAVAEDEILPRNPCRIKGAGDEQAAERPVLSVAQVFQLADEMKDQRYRALVLLTTFASLRWGEATALRRQDVDLAAGTVRVREAYVEHDDGSLTLGPPKSKAGRRIVSIPSEIVPEIRAHLERYTGKPDDALVFTGKKGGVLRRSNFRRGAGWKKAVSNVGAVGLHFHDLRHTGNTLAAQSGPSLRDLMARMGHDSTRAAVIYQHSSRAADKGIADALSERLKRERRTGADDGTDDA